MLLCLTKSLSLQYCYIDHSVLSRTNCSAILIDIKLDHWNIFSTNPITTSFENNFIYYAMPLPLHTEFLTTIDSSICLWCHESSWLLLFVTPSWFTFMFLLTSSRLPLVVTSSKFCLFMTSSKFRLFMTSAWLLMLMTSSWFLDASLRHQVGNVAL